MFVVHGFSGRQDAVRYGRQGCLPLHFQTDSHTHFCRSGDFTCRRAQAGGRNCLIPIPNKKRPNHPCAPLIPAFSPVWEKVPQWQLRGAPTIHQLSPQNGINGRKLKPGERPARFWTAAAHCHFETQGGRGQSGRGLPQSKTLARKWVTYLRITATEFLKTL